MFFFSSVCRSAYTIRESVGIEIKKKKIFLQQQSIGIAMKYQNKIDDDDDDDVERKIIIKRKSHCEQFMT